MNINLNGPITLVLDAPVVAVILDTLAKNLTYLEGQKILDGIIIPQLQRQDINNNPAIEVLDATVYPDCPSLSS